MSRIRSLLFLLASAAALPAQIKSVPDLWNGVAAAAGELSRTEEAWLRSDPGQAAAARRALNGVQMRYYGLFRQAMEAQLALLEETRDDGTARTALEREMREIGQFQVQPGDYAAALARLGETQSALAARLAKSVNAHRELMALLDDAIRRLPALNDAWEDYYRRPAELKPSAATPEAPYTGVWATRPGDERFEGGPTEMRLELRESGGEISGRCKAVFGEDEIEGTVSGKVEGETAQVTLRDSGGAQLGVFRLGPGVRSSEVHRLGFTSGGIGNGGPDVLWKQGSPAAVDGWAAIEILRGEGINKLGGGEGQRIQIRVLDEQGRPVGGANVQFLGPPEGAPGIVFAGGARRAAVASDSNGVAWSPPLTPVAPAGEVPIEIRAAVRGQVVGTMVYQRNVARPVGAAAATLAGTWELPQGAGKDEYKTVEPLVLTLQQNGPSLSATLASTITSYLRNDPAKVVRFQVEERFELERTGSGYQAEIASSKGRDRSAAKLTVVLEPAPEGLRLTWSGTIKNSGFRVVTLPVENTYVLTRRTAVK